MQKIHNHSQQTVSNGFKLLVMFCLIAKLRLLEMLPLKETEINARPQSFTNRRNPVMFTSHPVQKNV